MPTRELKRIIIHCAATPNGKEFHAADIDRWHKERGWTRIGYHFVIPLNGLVEYGRALSEIGAHASGHNRDSVGICLIGTDRFTIEQWDSLKNLVADLKVRHKTIEAVMGHRDLPGVTKSCPGFEVKDWLTCGMSPLPAHVL
jgi:N-acetyl-anhydromuramyl-L-alanine amidase AmpD